MKIEQIAAVCHEANRRLCIELGEDNITNAWMYASPEIKINAAAGVQFRLDNPDVEPSAQHDAWCKDKRDAGWVYGATKSEDAKTHPCLVPFDELPPGQQAKDVLFACIVLTLAGLLDEPEAA